MRVKSLSLRNIGPFIEADMEFFDDADASPPVVLITGENGTGKSIIIDAIRGMFGKLYGRLERNIGRRQFSDEPKIDIIVGIEQKDLRFQSKKILENQITFYVRHDTLTDMPQHAEQGKEYPNWIVDFWPSTLASGSYKIANLAHPQHNLFLRDALQGTKSKSDITQLICHFDYLRDSRDPREKAAGERLYEILEQIVESSLLEGGKLSHVARATYEPVIIQNGQPVGLENLSGGNSYLIQNLVSLLGKMYSVHVLRETPLEELGHTPGLLLIDEAENQLHPKWQKRFIRTILEIFPNLQIIATTHSPFIISSVSDARLFVCQNKQDHCVVVDETAQYANKPVDEILMSPLFEATRPFSEKISSLMEQREKAILEGDEQKRDKLEATLQALNPEYFAYFDVDKLLKEVAGGGTPA